MIDKALFWRFLLKKLSVWHGWLNLVELRYLRRLWGGAALDQSRNGVEHVQTGLHDFHSGV